MRFYHQTRNLPLKIEKARLKLKSLQEEAGTIGLRTEEARLAAINAAWERLVWSEQIKAQERGEEYSMGVDNA